MVLNIVIQLCFACDLRRIRILRKFYLHDHRLSRNCWTSFKSANVNLGEPVLKCKSQNLLGEKENWFTVYKTAAEVAKNVLIQRAKN